MWIGRAAPISLLAIRGFLAASVVPPRPREPPAMNQSIRGRLSVMMFLQYVIWGAWLPLLNLYMEKLGFDGIERAWVTNAFAIAAITAWLFGGQLADRYFEQSRFLSFSHLIGGLSMLGLAFLPQLVGTPAEPRAEGQTHHLFWPMFGLMLIHCFFYVPTLSITNAIAFSNLKDPQKDFGAIRLFGTLGWIAASWPFVFILIDWSKVPTAEQAGGTLSQFGEALGTTKSGESLNAALTSTFLIAGIVSFVLSAFCLTLPKTPPVKGDPDNAFAPLACLKLLAVPSILVLFIVTFFDSLVHYCYFFATGSFLPKIGLPVNWITPVMSIGQIAEIPAMALLGLTLKKLGWRTTMILGILGQTLRFAMYALGAKYDGLLWLVIASNLVHGFAYAFFFATVYIFVDENFPKDVRTSAQTLFNLLILGIGPLVGNILWGTLTDRYTVGEGAEATTDFFRLFLWPTGFGLLAFVILALFFHPPASVAKPSNQPIDELAPSAV